MKKIKKLISFIYAFLPKQNKYSLSIILCSILFSICSTLSSLLIPVFVGRGIDLFIDEEKELLNSEQLYHICMMIGLLALSHAIFSYFVLRINNKISYKLSQALKDKLINKINHLPIATLDTTPTGEIQSIMTSDIDQACDGINLALSQFITGILTILITLILMCRINLILTGVVILLTPLSLIVSSTISKNIYHYFKKQSLSRSKLSGYVEEIFEKEKTIKAYDYEETSINRFKAYNEELSQDAIKAVFFSSCVNPTTRLVNNIIYASLILLSSLLLIKLDNFSLTIGALSTFLAYSTQYAKPFNEISSVLSELQNSFACIERVEEILNKEEDTDNGTMVIHDSFETIDFKKVSFSYNKNKKLLEDLSIKVKKGDHIAIVGKTGSGKTTLINLLLRFYDIDEGEILVNNESTFSLTKQSLRSHFGMVLQDTWLKNGTIRENILFGSDKTDEEMIKACKITKAHQFIEKLPLGYDTIISNNNENLSIGEKQLICITRVLLTNPEILILDEATSNIDLMSEKQINEDIDLLMKGKTAFVVAHRLSTIMNSDCILVLKDGNILEMGRHEDLLKQNGYYKELFMSQFS